MTDTQAAALLKIEDAISSSQDAFLAFPRHHPLRSKGLLALAGARLARYKYSKRSEDLEHAIYYSTEAILLPFLLPSYTPIQLRSYIIDALFFLARALFLRSLELKQPGDVKHAVGYLRHLQDQSLESSTVTCNVIKAFLVQALANQVKLEPVDPTRDIGEMTTLCRELLTSGVKESLLIEAISLLAATMRQAAVRVVFGKPLPDGAIECLREARRRFPDLDVVRFALATSLSSRFRWAPSHDDYEEAMSILDEIIADDPNEYVELAMWLAGDLARFRYTRESEPEVLADAVFRTRTYLNALSSEHPDRRSIMKDLANLENKRFEEFGVTSGQQEDNAQVVDDPHLAASPKIAKSNHVEFPLPMPDESNPIPHVQALLSIEPITDLTNIEKAIEYCRLCLTSPHSYVPLTILMMGRLLYRVFNLTGNINSLHESITVYRDLIKMEAVPFRPHEIARQLIDYLVSRFTLFNDTRDIDEIMELFAVAAADTSAETPLRFRTSFECTEIARSIRHPSTLHAYQTAISLMQESISFAPTLEIQHFRLVAMRNQYEKLPLDYASYLVEIGQLKQAIEILERGRGLLWSQMRGLRASIVQLRAVNLPLAENFAAVNGELEALTISGSQLVGMEGGPAGVREGMDPFGRLVTKQRKLVEERDKLISQIRAQPGFDSFLIPPSFDTLRSAAAGGPVILINHSEWRSDIIILLHDTSPSLIPTREDFCGHAKRLHDKLLDARKKGLDSFEYEDALEEVLKHLYDLVGRPVIERLRELDIPEQSRVWWCPTSVFCSLPLHAMGPIPSNDSVKLYFSDIYISSYTPTLSALIESRELSTQLSDVPSMLLVVQPDDEIPSAFEEMNIVQAVCPSVETLIEKTATPIVILKYLTKQQFVHISCHGVLEPGKPFDAFFELYKGARLTLLDIVRSLLPSAEFAFLSACHTAEITEKSIANEGLHLAAAVQYSGFRSVVGTMWAVVDDNGPPVAEKFYKSVFSATDRWGGMPHHERTAKALRDAVRDLRKEMTLESWVNYVHYGA